MRFSIDFRCQCVIFLSLVPCGVGLAKPPVEDESRQEVIKTQTRLSNFVRHGASEDSFPWALAHGLMAFGKDFQTDARRPAIEAVMDHLQTSTIDGRLVYKFRANTPAGLQVEPHPQLILATLIEVGISPSTVLQTPNGSSVSIRRLISDAERLFRSPRTFSEWFDYPWAATLFLRTKSRTQQLKTFNETIPMTTFAQRGLEQLVREQAFLGEWMDQKAPHLVQKQRQGIYRHACGGLHFIQAGLHCSAFLGDETSLNQAHRQIDILRFRWHAERVLYRNALRENPSFTSLILIQQLKFYGHILETLVVAKRLSLFRSLPTISKFFREVAADLAHTVRQLAPLYASLPSIRKSQPRLYNDLIGDGCHAIKALKDGLQLFYAPSPPP
ncbi:MAG: hypothetical protein KTR25_18520 [Myxococcales bacterium]|nr:hypothetical protein [Myxococcales bacterium]